MPFFITQRTYAVLMKYINSDIEGSEPFYLITSDYSELKSTQF